MMENNELMEMDETIATADEQFEEALRRMQKLNISDKAQELFKNNSLALHTRYWLLPGIPLTVLIDELPEDIMEQVGEVEQEYGIKVYTVLKTKTEFGLLYDCLYVTKYKEEWEADDEMMDDNYIMSYCINTDIPEFSEFGSICIENDNGGLYRTC